MFVMALNMFGQLWTVLMITVYNAKVITRRPPQKLLQYVEKFSNLKDNRDNVTGNSVNDQGTLKDNGVNKTNKNAIANSDIPLVGMRYSEPNLRQSVQNYSREWRVIARGMDKLFFVVSTLLVASSIVGTEIIIYN